MVLLLMWLILQIVDGLVEEKKRAGATELYVISWKVVWTPDNIVPSRIVKLSTRITLALGMCGSNFSGSASKDYRRVYRIQQTTRIQIMIM